eukprot:3148864-Amphidinium_carterae.1
MSGKVQRKKPCDTQRRKTTIHEEDFRQLKTAQHVGGDSSLPFARAILIVQDLSVLRGSTSKVNRSNTPNAHNDDVMRQQVEKDDKVGISEGSP